MTDMMMTVVLHVAIMTIVVSITSTRAFLSLVLEVKARLAASASLWPSPLLQILLV